MVIVTALNNLRCTLRSELIATVVGSAPTTVLLTNGVSLEVRESAEDIHRQIERAHDGRESVVAGRSRHARTH